MSEICCMTPVESGAENPDLARKFVDLVTGESGQKILNQAGFAKP